MAERKAVNKYYPPEWSPSKGSINKFNNSHPLRDRARKLNKGILIVRFELPFNIWCEGCGNHVGMGVRYNAEKTKVGTYYTTVIYKFKMKCYLCDNHFEIQTDPKNFDYLVITGARRKTETWSHVEGETVGLNSNEEKDKIHSNPMYALEHNLGDKEKASSYTPQLSELYKDSLVLEKDYLINSKLRGTFRKEKGRLCKQKLRDDLLRNKTSLNIHLVPEHKDDINLAQSIKFRDNSKKAVKSQNIFRQHKTKHRSLFKLKIRSKSKLTSK